VNTKSPHIPTSFGGENSGEVNKALVREVGVLRPLAVDLVRERWAALVSAAAARRSLEAGGEGGGGVELEDPVETVTGGRRGSLPSSGGRLVGVGMVKGGERQMSVGLYAAIFFF
jgi:hypothetical protein